MNHYDDHQPNTNGLHPKARREYQQTRDPYRREEWHPGEQRPRAVPETSIREISIQIERKTFVLQRGNNHAGDFVRVIEHVGNRRNTVMVPASGLLEFIVALQTLSAP